MIVKGKVSAVKNDTADVILPEYENVVISASTTYRKTSLQVNDFVLVAVLNEDFNDCVIL